MKVYVATSWKSPHIEPIKAVLRGPDYQIYHFLESGYELDYNKIIPNLRNYAGRHQAKYIKHQKIMQSAIVNRRNLTDSDVFILAEPAGKGCYAEYGMAVERGIPTILLITDEYEIGVMDAFFDHIVSITALEETLRGYNHRR